MLLGTGRKSCLQSGGTGRASSGLSLPPRWHLRLNLFLPVTQKEISASLCHLLPKGRLGLTLCSLSQRRNRDFPSCPVPRFQVPVAVTPGLGTGQRISLESVWLGKHGTSSPGFLGFPPAVLPWSPSCHLGPFRETEAPDSLGSSSRTEVETSSSTASPTPRGVSQLPQPPRKLRSPLLSQPSDFNSPHPGRSRVSP